MGLASEFDLKIIRIIFSKKNIIWHRFRSDVSAEQSKAVAVDRLRCQMSLLEEREKMSSHLLPFAPKTISTLALIYDSIGVHVFPVNEYS